MPLACLARRWAGLLPWQHARENETRGNSQQKPCVPTIKESIEARVGDKLDSALWMMSESLSKIKS